MMLPILISRSRAPGLYFFCATAGLTAIVAPISAAAERTNQFFAISRFLPLVYGPCQVGLCFWAPLARVDSHPGAPPRPTPERVDGAGDSRRHHIHEGNQEDAVDRPRRRLGDLIGDVGDELDEERAVEGARDRGETADDDADQ